TIRAPTRSPSTRAPNQAPTWVSRCASLSTRRSGSARHRRYRGRSSNARTPRAAGFNATWWSASGSPDPASSSNHRHRCRSATSTARNNSPTTTHGRASAPPGVLPRTVRARRPRVASGRLPDAGSGTQVRETASIVNLRARSTQLPVRLEAALEVLARDGAVLLLGLPAWHTRHHRHATRRRRQGRLPAAADLVQLEPGRHLLRHQRRLDAVERPFQPAHQLSLGDAQLSLARHCRLGEGQREPLQLVGELRGEAVLQFHDRTPVDLLQPLPAGLVQRRCAYLIQELLDHAADAHHLRRLLHQLGRIFPLLGALALLAG